MKTILFLSQRAYEKYDFDQIKTDLEYRFVALLNDENYKSFPESQTPYFDKIYHFPKIKLITPYSKFFLDETGMYNAIENELTINPNPNDYVIICIDEFNLVSAVKLSEKFGIPSRDGNILERYRDKIRMKECLRNANIRVPYFMTFDIEQAKKSPKTYYQQLTATVSEHFVIKPVAGAASIETTEISHFSEFMNYIEKNGQLAKRFEAEEFIEGTLMHCDGFVSNDRILLSHVSEYSYPNMEITRGKIIASIPLEKTDPLNSKIKQRAHHIIKTLGYINNPFHMELFKTHNDEIIFLEVAARLPGINITDNYENLFGINFFNQDVVNHLRSVEQLKTHFKCYSFVGVIPKKQGRIKKINPPQFKSHYDIKWHVKNGDIIESDSKTLIDISGAFIVFNKNYSVLKKDFEYMHTYQPFEME